MKAISILSESDKIKFAKAKVEAHYDLIEPVTRFIKDTTQNKASSDEIVFIILRAFSTSKDDDLIFIFFK